jgi:hypothetical protein
MRVLAGPRLDLSADPRAAAMCRRLAGANGDVVSLAALGLRNPYRPFSAAEVHALRAVLREERQGTGVIGYVCRGVPAPGGSPAWVAVTDHANLTWRSPLAGPNDEEVGPRFPGMLDVYLVGAAVTPGAEQDGIMVTSGVVAGLQDDRAMNEYEAGTLADLGWVAASSELVAPVIVAAHMGLRVSAVVMAV